MSGEEGANASMACSLCLPALKFHATQVVSGCQPSCSDCRGLRHRSAEALAVEAEKEVC